MPSPVILLDSSKMLHFCLFLFVHFVALLCSLSLLQVACIVLQQSSCRHLDSAVSSCTAMANFYDHYALVSNKQFYKVNNYLYIHHDSCSYNMAKVVHKGNSGSCPSQNQETSMMVPDTSCTGSYQGKDVVACAPTGAGKTLSFWIPLLMAIKDGINAMVIVVTPSNLLGKQNVESLGKMGLTGVAVDHESANAKTFKVNSGIYNQVELP